MLLPKDYAKKIAERAKKSHIYRDYQLTGIQISEILGDVAHKALYIKLAKEMKGEMLLRIAKTVAQKREVANKGGYFMKIIQMEREKMPKPAPAPRKRKYQAT